MDSPWLYGILVVSFHITKGHVLESKHPKHWSPSAEETKAVTRFGLPDSTFESEGDVRYVFRYRPDLADKDSFSFGSVFFRQTKDPGAPRGYRQASVVALCRSPDKVAVANEFVRLMGPLYFSFGPDVLEAACVECARWPKPVLGRSERLTFHLAESTFTIPPILTGKSNAGDDDPEIMDLFQSVLLFSTFGSLSVGLWLIWELVLTGQPVLVLGPSPDRCSNAVLGMCSLIAPIPFAMDYRPYFTIFDGDFAAISRSNAEPSSVIVGGTNPMLLRSLEHFPNVVSLGPRTGHFAAAQQQAATADARQASYFPSIPFFTQSDEFGGSLTTTVAKKGSTLRSLLKNRRWEKSLIITRDEPLVPRDEKLISLLKLGNAGEDPAKVVERNNVKLRLAFRALSESFIRPLESFVRLKSVGERAAKGGLRVSAYHDDVLREVGIKMFSAEAFLGSLKASPDYNRAMFSPALYRKFIAGPNFPVWLDVTIRRVAFEQYPIRRSLIVHTDSQTLLMTGVNEKAREITYSRVVTALNVEMAKPERDDELCKRMEEHRIALKGRESPTI